MKARHGKTGTSHIRHLHSSQSYKGRKVNVRIMAS